MGKRQIGPKPLYLRSEDAVQTIRDRLEDGGDAIVFPLPVALGVKALNAMPSRMAAWLGRKFGFIVVPDKESDMRP